MNYPAFLETRTDIYAYFHGAISAEAGETCHVCRRIVHNNDYKAMYEALREKISALSTELDRKLEEAK